MHHDIADFIQIQSQCIERELSRLVPEKEDPSSQLFEASRYSLLNGGKRLRPLLTLAVTQSLDGSASIALTPACALEIIHTYSLIHDDLPCMDNDDYRRGKLTVHKKYNEGHAVLTGDFLLTYAFEVLAMCPNLSPEQKVQLISILAHRSGSEGMIGGQVMDIAVEGKSICIDTLHLLHRKKTAALLTAAVEFGGVISEASSAQMIALRKFGESIGLAYQVIDDVLDVTKQRGGSAIGSDARNHKSTFATLLGIDKAHVYAQNCYSQAMSALESACDDTTLLQGLAQFIVQRKY
jgi:geranylgeranyl diphosphate synthase, type II